MMKDKVGFEEKGRDLRFWLRGLARSSFDEIDGISDAGKSAASRTW